ncbi:TPA: ribonuclease Y [Patescibacteria group bacterium]|nr:MAG: Ribonuclease Y [Parcubacteria group bacterium GW2011_GWD2_42_14]HCC04704.1 ribonuclease Y [Patescibacteria group bacterium]
MEWDSILIMSPITIFIVLGTTLIGVAFGYYLRYIIAAGKRGSMELEVKQMMLEAKEKAKNIEEVAEKKIEEAKKEAEKEIKEKQEFIKKSESRILDREAFLDKRQQDLDKEIEHVKAKIENVHSVKARVDELKSEVDQEIERIAKLTKDEAKEELMSRIEHESQEDMVVRMQKLERFGAEKLERKAMDILTTAIHRLGNAVTTDVLTTSIALPNEDIKGKIIGKEGRNIRAFERATGVDVLIDDTPGLITLSCFDPVRRQIARVALENLIIDGRIQPAKIEEQVQKATDEINRIIKEKAEQAAYEVGVMNLDPRVLMVLGRLHFRTSYGQNVLQHSVEMAHIAGLLAEELGADVQVARAGALVHDIGKAVDHDVQGTHVEIGRRILLKFGVDEKVISSMQSHHGEYPYETPESIIIQVADSISGGRPGARRDSVENYLKRLTDLENIANSFEGVEKSYAIAAGREVRIFVRPESVSDLEARDLARSIATKVEQELKYPGEIKIAVIRENRAIEYAR